MILRSILVVFRGTLHQLPLEYVDELLLVVGVGESCAQMPLEGQLMLGRVLGRRTAGVLVGTTTGLGNLRGLLVVRGDYALLRLHTGVVSHDLGQRLSLVLLSFVQQWLLPLDHNPTPLDLRCLIA